VLFLFFTATSLRLCSASFASALAEPMPLLRFGEADAKKRRSKVKTNRLQQMNTHVKTMYNKNIRKNIRKKKLSIFLLIFLRSKFNNY